jgi:hypothetical protein
MTRQSFMVRIALTLLVLPFLLAGILLAGLAYSWLYDFLTGDLRVLLVPAFMALAIAGILLGALIAYGLLAFFFHLVVAE